MKKVVTVCLICLAISPLIAQPENILTAIPSKQLKEDLYSLKTNLELMHPGLYTYTPKAAMDSTFKTLEKALDQPMTQVEFYRHILPLHNKIRNGHSMIIPPEPWSKHVEKEAVHLPFDVYPYDGGVYVLRNFSEEVSIREGDQLVSIDGIPAIAIFDKLIQKSTKDGYNQTYASAIIEQDFSEFYANIFDTEPEHTIVVESDSVRSYLVKSQTIRDIRDTALTRYNFQKRPWYNSIANSPLTYSTDENVATLTLPTFNIDDIKDQGINYEKFFKDTFEKINEEKINELIIDLRGNGGGHGDVGVELFSYLANEPFRLIKDIYAVTNKIHNKDLYSDNQFWISIQLKLALKKVEERRYVPLKFAAKKNHLTLNEKEPSSPHYSGNIYVLIDGWVFSASAMFAALLQNNNKGIFIGEETGGNPNVQVGDFAQMLTLPNTGLRMLIPLLYEEMEVSFPNTGNGILPNYDMRNDVSSKLNGVDSVKLWTLNMIKNKNTKK